MLPTADNLVPRPPRAGQLAETPLNAPITARRSAAFAAVPITDDLAIIAGRSGDRQRRIPLGRNVGIAPMAASARLRSGPVTAPSCHLDPRCRGHRLDRWSPTVVKLPVHLADRSSSWQRFMPTHHGSRIGDDRASRGPRRRHRSGAPIAIEMAAGVYRLETVPAPLAAGPSESPRRSGSGRRRLPRNRVLGMHPFAPLCEAPT